MPKPDDRPHELQDFLEEVSAELRLEYGRITRRSREDPGTAGDEGESNWRGLLEGWLPSELPVVTKGRILSEDGTSSPQLDVLILHPGYPQRLRDRKQYLAAGVIAAFECKLTLRKRDLPKIAETARQVRRLVRTSDGSLYGALHSRITFGVLAHSSEWSRRVDEYTSDVDDADFESRARRFDECLRIMLQGDSHPREALDVVCISDLACWTRFVSVASPATWGGDSRLWEASRTLYNWPEDGAVQDQYIRWSRIEPEWDGPPNPLYVLIGKLLRRVAWELDDHRSLAEYWMLAKIPGQSGAAGAVRNWPLDILGDASERVRRGAVVNGDRWHRWSHAFF